MRAALVAFFALALAGLPATRAFAWAETGHRMIGRLGVESLPEEIPAFLRTPQAVAQIGELAREPDRSKGSGQPHDADLDPGHFVDVDDQGRILGGPLLADLPGTRASYEKALQAAGTDSWKAGYLPYSIIEGWQQLVKDFAMWRVERIGEATAPKPEDRAWFASDRRLRETLILRDLGVWSHYVGDASQPLHVSIHYNGWGDSPNPFGFTQEKIHAPFEGEFVHQNVKLEAVRAAMPPPAECNASIKTCVSEYLEATYAQVVPVYRYWGQGDFQSRDPAAIDFTTARIAAGAAALRDLTVKAWRASADAQVGYPPISVRSVEGGQAPPIGSLYGLN